MIEESLKETIKRELPTWLREDPELRAYILDLTRRELAGRAEPRIAFTPFSPNCATTGKNKPANGTSKTTSGRSKTASGMSSGWN